MATEKGNYVMKYLLALLLVSSAQAADFGAATYCPSYCTGFTTSDPAVTLDYIMFGEVGLSVNGVIYRNPNALSYAQQIGVVNANTTLWTLTAPYTSDSGAVITMTVTYQKTVTLINSGRTHAIRTSYVDLGGSLN